MQVKFLILFSLVVFSSAAQAAGRGPETGQEPQPSETSLLQAILSRMDTLEKQNRQMAQEIHDLQVKLENAQAGSAPLPDRVAVAESRIDEQAQTKVEASQKLPITITGQLLFNAFAGSGHVGALPDSIYSPFINTADSAGLTVRQTLLGFDFQGPSLPGDGKLNGHLMLDFYSGLPTEQYDWLRVRTSDVSFDWDRRSFAFALDKALISPRQPNSLAEVAIPPLAGSGNLWLWLPQLRYQERIKLGQNAGIVAQGALLQTDESYDYVPAAFSSTLEQSRPAGEGRLEFWKRWDEHRRLEIAGGFHAGSSHVAATGVNSRLYSTDWLLIPASKLEISGTYFHGQNFAPLGALSNGFSILGTGLVAPVHGDGGWNQFSIPLNNRFTFNLFAGLQKNRFSDLENGQVETNLTYAGNIMFHVSQNVVLSLEALQMRTSLKQDGDLIRNRYDLAVGYLF